MLKKTLLRFAILLVASLAFVLLVLHPSSLLWENLWLGLLLSFFCYSFSWVKEGIKWLGAFFAKYGCMAILFRSLPAMLLLLIFAFIGFSAVCMVGIIAGIARFLYNVGASIVLDRSNMSLQKEDDPMDLW